MHRIVLDFTISSGFIKIILFISVYPSHLLLINLQLFVVSNELRSSLVMSHCEAGRLRYDDMKKSIYSIQSPVSVTRCVDVTWYFHFCFVCSELAGRCPEYSQQTKIINKTSWHQADTTTANWINKQAQPAGQSADGQCSNVLTTSLDHPASHCLYLLNINVFQWITVPSDYLWFINWCAIRRN